MQPIHLTAPEPPSDLLDRDDVLRIALVRHGETFQNRGEVVQGQNPTYGRLTEAGMKQARLLGQAFVNRQFDAAYCSPLERAVLTLSLMLIPRAGDRTLPLHFDPNLREIHLGNLEGRPRAEWHTAMDPDQPMEWRPQGGESWEDVRTRVERWFRESLLPAAHRDVLIVAHGGVNRALIATLTGLSMGETWQGPGIGAPQSNTCVNDLLVGRDGQLLWALVNDTRHLAGQTDGASPGQLWNSSKRCWELIGPVADSTAGTEFKPYG